MYQQKQVKKIYLNPANPSPDKVTVCSKALRLSDAILLPLHGSSIPCMPHAICDVTPGGEFPFVKGDSHEELTP